MDLARRSFNAGRRLGHSAGACVRTLVATAVVFLVGCEQKPASQAVAPAPAPAAETKGRVLFIGIDGCRYDALDKAKAPHLKRLRDAGCYADDTLIQGERYTSSDTVSGPGWSSLLTGVWADKHGVVYNRFAAPRFERYPMFFKRLREADPQAETVAFSSWPPISKRIVSDADLNLMFGDEKDYSAADRESAAATIDTLRRGNPRAIFCYLGQVDEHGHKYGFSPGVPEYIGAIERVDALVGTVIDALERRPNYAAENWLVLVSTDHGGIGTDHAGGRDVPEVMRGFILVSGRAAQRSKLKEQTYIVDVAATALVHLGVKLDPKWELDGKPVGLKGR